MKIIALAVFAATIAYSAAAETSKTWGSFGTPSTVSIVPSDRHEADILFENTLTNESPTTMTFLFNDSEYYVAIEFGAGDIPDIIRVVPPTGFYAIPDTLSVDDDTTGIIEIHIIPMG